MENYLTAIKRPAKAYYNTVATYVQNRSPKVSILIIIICVMCITFIPLNKAVINKARLGQLRTTSQPVTTTSSTLSPFVPNETQCSNESLLTQSKKFEEIFSKDMFWSACYSKDYIEKFYLADLNIPHRQNKLFFDIGANKGFTIAAWLSVWKPDIGINPQTLFSYISTKLGITDCGACSDCKEAMTMNHSRDDRLNTTLEIHAFEPIETTCKALLQVQTQFNLSRFHVHQVAMSNTTGVADMPKCLAGGELCGLMNIGRTAPNDGTFQVKTLTLDDFVEENKIKQQIDILKIDTEGADPLVLQGAKKLFERGQVRLLIFEYQGIGVWGETSLFEVTKSLNTYGFTCYIIGKTGMIRLTDCWVPAYEMRRWSNMLCVHRREEHLRRFLDPLRVLDI